MQNQKVSCCFSSWFYHVKDNIRKLVRAFHITVRNVDSAKFSGSGYVQEIYTNDYDQYLQ